MFRQRGVRNGIGNALTLLRRAKESVLKILGKLWPRKINEFLHEERILSGNPSRCACGRCSVDNSPQSSAHTSA